MREICFHVKLFKLSFLFSCILQVSFTGAPPGFRRFDVQAFLQGGCIMADQLRPGIPSIQETALQTARSGRNMFITGSAGTGKSSLERILTKDAESRTRVTRVSSARRFAQEC